MNKSKKKKKKKGLRTRTEMSEKSNTVAGDGDKAGLGNKSQTFIEPSAVLC